MEYGWVETVRTDSEIVGCWRDLENGVIPRIVGGHRMVFTRGGIFNQHLGAHDDSSLHIPSPCP